MDGSFPSSSAFATELTQTDEVSKKLRGGVWERSELARGIYGGVLGFGRWLANHGITPNSLTYAALALAVASGIAAALGLYLAAAACLLVSGAFDLLDGIVARAAHLNTRFGALLDSTVDRLADALPLLGLVVACSETALASAVLVVAMMTGFAVSYVRARAEGLGISLPPLFMRRAERVVLLLLALVVGSVNVPGFPSEVAMISIIGVMALLSLVAAIWALRSAYLVLAVDEVARVTVPAAPTPSRP
ncbi:MAG TPA: CDP-alcohol phosphatidyltransferase family protein [Polyangiaceae bacterium]|nr:CDP-alcohol phosphatidyltransferase family protein [Polyangiaceae bacterium]